MRLNVFDQWPQHQWQRIDKSGTALSDPDFQIFSDGAIAPEYGTGSATFTRAGTPMVQGHDGVWVAVSANQEKMLGLRYTGGAWSTTDASANPLFPTETVTAGSYSITRCAVYNNWAASTAYSLGDRVYPEDYSWVKCVAAEDHYFQCTSAGTSGGSEPSWDTTTIDSSTTTDNTVTWTYKGLATYKGIKIEPAATNDVDYSYELNNATGGWTETNITVAIDQTGIDGSSNKATILTDGSSSTNAGISQAFSTASSSVFAAKFWVKKDADNSTFPAIGLAPTSSAVGLWHLNTSTGALSISSDVQGVSQTGSVHLEGDWWVVTLDETPSSARSSCTIYCQPSRATTLNGAVDVTAQRSAIFGQVELYAGKLKEEVEYLSPIQTSGATASRTTELGYPSYVIGNYTDNAQSITADIVWLEDPRSDSGIVSVNGGNNDFISYAASGNTFDSDDGTNTATIAQAVTPGTLYRIGQRQSTTKQQMSEGGANGTEGTYDNSRTTSALTMIEGTGAVLNNVVIVAADLGISTVNTLTGND